MLHDVADLVLEVDAARVEDQRVERAQERIQDVLQSHKKQDERVKHHEGSDGELSDHDLLLEGLVVLFERPNVVLDPVAVDDVEGRVA